MPRFSYLLAAVVAAGSPAMSFAGEVPSFATEVMPYLAKAG